MVGNKKSATIKAGAIILSIMLFFTFFSGSINYFLSPKVTFAIVKIGALTIDENEFEKNDTVFGVLIPRYAIIDGNSVFIITQEDTIMGKRLYVSRRYIDIVAMNKVQAAVSNGLSDGDRIVTSWDRSIQDGQRVVLPND